MSFPNSPTNDLQALGGGERFASTIAILTADDFEDGLRVGRFAQIAAGRLDNMDGTATPNIAGVVLRNVSTPVEDGTTLDADLYHQADYARGGFVTVDVKDGETPPAMFGAVYVSNAGDADDGLATSTDTDLTVNAEFIREVQVGVWLVYLAPPL